jgi:subtilisin family serine protease
MASALAAPTVISMRSRSLIIALSMLALPFVPAVAQAAAPPSPAETAQKLWATRPASTNELVLTYRVNNKPVVVRATAGTLATVTSVLSAAGASVLGVEWNAPVRMLSDDEHYSRLWGLVATRAESVWPTADGTGVTVAVVDTGVASHPDLQGRVLEGKSFLNGVASNGAIDDNGHGTHVAGTIAAVANNGTGVAGVAPGARILPLKALDSSGSGSLADVASAIVFAADNGAKVINLSLGSSGASTTMQNATQYAASKGVLVVAAAGNGGVTASPSYPAADPTDQVIAVAAHDELNQPASFSQDGAYIDVAAPGVRVLSTYLSSNYVYLNGTSMAAPHVAGVAALLLSAKPGLARADLRSAILNGAVDIHQAGRDTRTGTGRVDAVRSLALLSTTPAPPTTVAPTPTTTPAPPTTVAPTPTTTPAPPTTVAPTPTTTPAPPTTVAPTPTTTPAPPTTVAPTPTTTTPPKGSKKLPAPKSPRSQIWSADVVVSASLVPQARSYHIELNGAVIAQNLRLPTFSDRQRATIAGTWTYAVRGVAADGTLGDPAYTTISINPPAPPALLNHSTAPRRVNLEIAALPSGVTAWQVLRSGVTIAQIPAKSTRISLSLPHGKHALALRAISASGVSTPTQEVTFDVKRN